MKRELGRNFFCFFVRAHLHGLSPDFVCLLDLCSISTQDEACEPETFSEYGMLSTVFNLEDFLQLTLVCTLTWVCAFQNIKSLLNFAKKSLSSSHLLLAPHNRSVYWVMSQHLCKYRQLGWQMRVFYIRPHNPEVCLLCARHILTMRWRRSVWRTGRLQTMTRSSCFRVAGILHFSSSILSF